MAKPLLVRTERSPATKLPLSGGNGIAQLVTIGAQVPIHVVPEGYRDELYVWANNNDAANDGSILIELNGNPSFTIIGALRNREIEPILIDGMILEARTADIVVDALALTEPAVVWGWVFRTALEDL